MPLAQEVRSRPVIPFRTLQTSLALMVLTPCFWTAPAFAGWQVYAHRQQTFTVTAIYGDRSENVWFGTANGEITRFDGETWTNYNIRPGDDGDVPGNGLGSVNDIAGEPSGTLWFARALGVSRFDGETWRRFTSQDGLLTDGANCVEIDSAGNKWFGTALGASRFDGQTWETFLSGNYISDIHRDRSGVMWFLMQTGAVWSLDGKLWRNKGKATFAGICSALTSDAEGRIWVAATDGIHRFDGAWTHFTAQDGLTVTYPVDIAVDDSGRVWVAAYDGITLFDGLGFRTFYEGSRYHSVAIDPAGAAWFGGAVDVLRFDGGAWDTFLDGSYIYSLDVDPDGSLWIATTTDLQVTPLPALGVVRFDGQTWTTFDVSSGLPTNEVNDVHVDPLGRLWLGTTKGAVQLVDGVPTTIYTTADGLANDDVFAIRGDVSGGLWFGTRGGGVSYFDGVNWTTYTVADGLASNIVFGIEIDSSANIWVSTNRGLSRFDGANWTTYTTADGLASNNVGLLHQDSSGALWVPTEQGLNRLENGVWSTFKAADGLPSDGVLGVWEDAQGGLWAGGAAGAARRVGSGWTQVIDGLPHPRVFGIKEATAGALWFATGRGLARLDLDRVAPQTRIKGAPELVSANRSPTVTTGVGFREIDDFKFSFSLDGGPWSDWSVNSWTAPLLSDGAHVIEVQSRDRMGNVDPTPASVSFEIDATAPVPVVASPRYGDAVQGVVTVTGTAADPRFEGYKLESRPVGSQDWTILNESAVPVVNDVLGVWDTSSLPDGDYDLQVSVSDSLDLTGFDPIVVEVDNEFPPADLTSPAVVTFREGGDVYTTHQEVHLYFEPGAFRKDATVAITLADETAVPATLVNGESLVLGGAEASWGESELLKSAILSMSLADADPGTDPKTLAIYGSRDGVTWERMGGSVDQDRISTAITAPGRYAVFGVGETTATPTPRPPIAVAPRVLVLGSIDRLVNISFSLDHAASPTIRVYNRAGRLMQELASGRSFNPGTNVVQWDGRGRDGNPVVDGLYIVSVAVDGEILTKTLSVVH